MGFRCGSVGKESACDVGVLGSVPGLGRSPGGGKGHPLQYSDLENPMDYSPWGPKELDTTERLLFFFFLKIDILIQWMFIELLWQPDTSKDSICSLHDVNTAVLLLWFFLAIAGERGQSLPPSKYASLAQGLFLADSF